MLQYQKEFTLRIYKDLEIKMVEQLDTGVMRITAYYGKECFWFPQNFTVWYSLLSKNRKKSQFPFLP